MKNLYVKFFDKHDERPVREAVILSPKQVSSLHRFLYITEASIVENKTNLIDFSNDFESDLQLLSNIKNKVEDIINNHPRTFTLFEGFLLVSLTMTFKYRHHDTDNISEDIEYLAQNIYDLFHEKGHLLLLYIFKEYRLPQKIKC